ncbi:lipid droplet-regulating VLDL assembly factor AUP1 [Lissotriton helveticus]
MEAPPVDRLFHVRRLPNDGFLLLLLLLYCPVGLCLLVLRVFIGVHVFLVSCALPDSLFRRFIVRVMCSLLGMFVRQNDPRLRDRSVKVFVCNHTTHFDHNIINLLFSCNTPMLNGVPGFLCWARGFMELGTAWSRAELLEHLKQYVSQEGSLPLLLFPEEEATNGRVGLLKFSSWPFSIQDDVQPVAMHVQRPFVATSLADSSFLTELLWTLFVPFTVYQVRWLPTMSKQDGEYGEELAVRAQELLALELGIVSTHFTSADKAEYLKRLRHIPPETSSTVHNRSMGARPRVPAGVTGLGLFPQEDARLPGMAQQVREVLPQVPLDVIKRDLAKTDCVDTTIANLLEGTISFTAEDATSGGLAQPTMSATDVKRSSYTTAHTSKPNAKTFARSPTARHLSLQERKDALYDYARSRYLQKYGPPSSEKHE